MGALPPVPIIAKGFPFATAGSAHLQSSDRSIGCRHGDRSESAQHLSERPVSRGRRGACWIFLRLQQRVNSYGRGGGVHDPVWSTLRLAAVESVERRDWLNGSFPDPAVQHPFAPSGRKARFRVATLVIVGTSLPLDRTNFAKSAGWYFPPLYLSGLPLAAGPSGPAAFSCPA